MNDSLPQPNPPPRPPRPPRWWPAVVILAALVATVAWFVFGSELDRQGRFLRGCAATLLAGLLLVVWLVGFSRLRWRVRLLAVAVLALLIGLGATTLRIQGVSGDLVPMLGWRWTAAKRMTATAPVTAAPGVAPSPASDTDWPRFLGPRGDGTLDGPKLATNWMTSPPKELWRIPMGPAWSGFAIAQGIAVTQEQDGPRELVTAYDASSGQPLWRHADEARYATTIAGEGPRATPAISGERVLTMGATGWLNCLDLRTGKKQWSHDLLKEYGGRSPDWGISVSPWVWGQSVIVSAGGPKERSLVAFRLATGELTWGQGDDPLGYSSPALQTICGVPQIVVFNGSAVTGNDPATGALLWRYPWRSPEPHVANPVVTSSNTLAVSQGYGFGAELLRLTPGTNRWTVERVWKSNRLKAKFSNFFHFNGHLYGLDDGILACVDAATGQLRWKEGRYGHGQMILVDQLLLILTEDGQLVLVQPSPQALREQARLRVLTGKTWNSPALAGDRVWLRNDREAVCLQLPIAR